MKLRLFPVALTFVITGGLLFGGWYAYQSLAVDNPLYGQIESIAGIDDFTLETSRDRVAIRVKLDERADLPAVWTTLHEQMKPYAGQRQLYIRVMGEASPELDRLWSTALFDVAEAMDARRYGDIPDRMLELEQAADGLHIRTAIDDYNVYITLELAGGFKHVVLPRRTEIGVWPNESV